MKDIEHILNQNADKKTIIEVNFMEMNYRTIK